MPWNKPPLFFCTATIQSTNFLDTNPFCLLRKRNFYSLFRRLWVVDCNEFSCLHGCLIGSFLLFHHDIQSAIIFCAVVASHRTLTHIHPHTHTYGYHSDVNTVSNECPIHNDTHTLVVYTFRRSLYNRFGFWLANAYRVHWTNTHTQRKESDLVAGDRECRPVDDDTNVKHIRKHP